jgi:hypothetical protein
MSGFGRRRRAWMVAGLVLAAAGLASRAVPGAYGTVVVEIHDAATGELTPAMVCITSLDDHTWRAPPDGRKASRYTRVADFKQPTPWIPGDIGPVRLTRGDPRDNDTRSHVLGEQPGYPFWQEPAAYFVSRPFEIRLPPGRWRLAVARGLEYLPVIEEFEVAAAERRAYRVDLRRWEHMAARGWYSGDTHVHFPRTEPWHDELLLTWAQAEEVYVSTILQQRTRRGLTFPQGPPAGFRAQRGEYVLQTGQEDPSTGLGDLGHTLALNISQPVYDRSRFHLYDVMFDAVRADGGLTGYAHLAWAPDSFRRSGRAAHATWDATINVIQGRVDFFEILQFRALGVEDYYDFLNLGMRLTASAGSDMPWAGSIGESRVYVNTGHPFSADRWFEAFGQGRTFVTNGPMLSLTVDGAGPGEQVAVDGAATVRIRARAWSPPAIGSPKWLEVVSQGAVIRSAMSDDPAAGELALDFTQPVHRSAWVAARVTTHNDGLAHTSPVYVLRDGRSHRDAERLHDLVAKRLGILAHGEQRLRDPKYTAAFAPGEADALRRRIAAARARYEALLAPGDASRPR